MFTLEGTEHLLNRVKSLYPDTVEEALAARCGLEGIRLDLVEWVRQKRHLKSLPFVLDTLANYPQDSCSAESIKDERKRKKIIEPAMKATVGIGDYLPDKLEGKRTKKQSVKKSVAQKRYAQAYDEAILSLPEIQSPIRVYIGGSQYFTAGLDQCWPELLEGLAKLRGNVYNQFGFRAPEVTCKWELFPLDEDEFRIEILDQQKGSKDDMLKPTKMRSDQAIKQLVGELQWRLTAFRAWWLTPEYVRSLLDSLPGGLRKWLESRYTLTDLKLILRSVIAPGDDELAAYREGQTGDAIRRVSPEQTLRNLQWLLGSLPFWTQVIDPLDAEEVVQALQDTQRSRISPPAVPKETESTAAVRLGIKELEDMKLESACKSFQKSVETDERGAERTFLAIYSRRPQFELAHVLADLEKKSALPEPGRAPTARKPSGDPLGSRKVP